MTTSISGVGRRVDAMQRRRSWSAVVVAAGKKFSDDQSTSLAALMAFWGFFSIFPLLMVFSTLLGWFVPDGTRQDVLSNVQSYFPLLDVSGDSTLSGSWWALIVGLVGALWGATGIARTAQFAFNSVWEVPFAERPNIISKTIDGLKLFAVVGLGLVVGAVISGVITGTSEDLSLGWGARLGGFVLVILLDVGVFIAAFRILTARDLSTRDVLPGAVFAGVAFYLLQSLSTLIISRYLNNAQSTYGNFATVITILWWFYLGANLALLGAQVNVVLKERLWPRSIAGEETDADRRVQAMLAGEERRQEEDEQRIDVRFDEGSEGGPGQSGAGR